MSELELWMELLHHLSYIKIPDFDSELDSVAVSSTTTKIYSWKHQLAQSVAGQGSYI